MKFEEYFKKADQYRVEGITHDTVPAKVEKAYHDFYKRAIKKSVQQPKEDTFSIRTGKYKIRLGKINFELLEDLFRKDDIVNDTTCKLYSTYHLIARDTINNYIETAIYEGKTFTKTR